jgi:ribonuclease HI
VNYLESFSKTSYPIVDVKGKNPIPLDGSYSHADLAASSSWVAPWIGEIKANVDAGWDALSKRAGIRVIVRDHVGHVILSERKLILGCTCAEEVEIDATIVGLNQLINLGRWPASLELDCARVVQTVSSSVVDRSGFWCLYDEARELLKVFSQISMKKVDRSSNSAAHSLAQLVS